MKHLILGCGEVGSAIGEVLECTTFHDPTKRKYASPDDSYDFMHVCIRYFDDFVHAVERAQIEFRPACTIIHSTVPIGTSDSLSAVHSPIRGKHPNLAESIRRFVKYFGGVNADIATQPFRAQSIVCLTTENARDTEALKLWDTAQYGLMIILEKEIHRWCAENHCDFDLIYRHANESYNAGYRAMSMDWNFRPSLEHMNGPIGGHCVIPNAELLDSWIAGILVAQNNLLKQPKKKYA